MYVGHNWERSFGFTDRIKPPEYEYRIVTLQVTILNST
jgi:hypothetical protein